jgi:amino acid transporter
LYNFGALIAYVIVGLSLISLRNREKAIFRPFKAPGNINIKPFWRKNKEASDSNEQYTIPIIGVLSIIADLTIWLLVVILHPLGRVFGSLWMGFGLVVFFAYTRFQKTRRSPPPDSSSTEASPDNAQ